MVDPGPIPGLPGIHLRRPRGIANFIEHIVTHPCADPWFVLIETFAPSALKLGWTLVAPDWEDLLRAYAENYARLPGGKRGGRKSHGPRVPLSLGGTVLPYQVSSLLRATLFITAPIETIGWWWLVWNATDEFWSDWHSLLVHNAYCSADATTGPFQAHDNDSNVTFSGVDWNAATPVVDQNRAGWSHTNFSVSVPAGIYQVIFTGEWPRAEILGDLPGCQLWIKCSNVAPGTGEIVSEEFTLPAGGRGGTVITGKFWVLNVAGGTITWGTRGDAGVAATLGGTCRVMVMGI